MKKVSTAKASFDDVALTGTGVAVVILIVVLFILVIVFVALYTVQVLKKTNGKAILAIYLWCTLHYTANVFRPM